jgi:hypothetical protein
LVGFGFGYFVCFLSLGLYVVQGGLALVILLPLPPEYWLHRPVYHTQQVSTPLKPQALWGWATSPFTLGLAPLRSPEVEKHKEFDCMVISSLYTCWAPEFFFVPLVPFLFGLSKQAQMPLNS